MPDPFGSTSVPQEQVELGRLLMKLNNRIPAFVAKIVPGQVHPDEWKGLAEVFKALAAECEQQAVVIETDGPSWGPGGAQPNAEPLRPAGTPLQRWTFSASGPGAPPDTHP